ncbi:MAG: hypothetical protein ABR96_00085 [cyanobacterium BACL30 MAG-120619-bin27]|nr:MAG: hypothetical protein ABR96_00085 [cyanobacterium BACL30 MAG-120619-bin27]
MGSLANRLQAAWLEREHWFWRGPGANSNRDLKSGWRSVARNPGCPMPATWASSPWARRSIDRR